MPAFSSNLASDDHLDVTGVGRNNLVVATPKSVGMAYETQVVFLCFTHYLTSIAEEGGGVHYTVYGI